MEESGFQSLFSFCPTQKTYTSSSATPLNMQSWETAGNRILSHHDSGLSFSNKLSPNSQLHFPFHLFATDASSSLRTEDDQARVYGHQQSIVDNKRLRRMISNRESARRSRMRKKQQIEELQSQVDQLQTVNRQLSQKVISLLESNHEILQENAQLKEKVSTLHIVLADVFTPQKNLEDTSQSPHGK